MSIKQTNQAEVEGPGVRASRSGRDCVISLSPAPSSKGSTNRIKERIESAIEEIDNIPNFREKAEFATHFLVGLQGICEGILIANAELEAVLEAELEAKKIAVPDCSGFQYIGRL